jgi:hypothetical protein
MNNRRKNHSERDVRCITFCDERPTDFTEDSVRGKTLARLRALQKQIETLDAECATHDRTKMQGTSGKKEDREALTKMVNAITRTADLVGPDYPEVKGAFRRPKANSNDQTLLSTARSILVTVTEHKSKFVEFDMPKDIDEQLKALIEKFAQSTQLKVSGASAKSTTNSALDEAFRAADHELQKLNTLVRNKYADDPATLAAWEHAYRLERTNPGKNGGSKGETEKDSAAEK